MRGKKNDFPFLTLKIAALLCFVINKNNFWMKNVPVHLTIILPNTACRIVCLNKEKGSPKKYPSFFSLHRARLKICNNVQKLVHVDHAAKICKVKYKNVFKAYLQN